MSIKGKHPIHSRRDFLGFQLPAFSIACLGFHKIAPVVDAVMDPTAVPPKHKFQLDWCRTYEESFRWRFSYYVQIMERFGHYLGREKMIEMIKRAVDENTLMDKEPDNPKHSLREMEKSGSEQFKNMMTWEVVELSDKAFEMKVSECLWTKIFKELNATDIGFATICYGDFADARSYHSKCRLLRSKTLMQGHDCCNHRWIWED